MKNNNKLLATLFLLAAMSSVQATRSNAAQWSPVTSSDGSNLTPRHEAASVVSGNDIYLLGGRGNRPVERFSTTGRQWEHLGNAPLEMHHMQPVIIGSRIYFIGALTCCYPQEDIVDEIYVFDMQTETWDVVGTLPASRRRGSTAAVAYKGRIYVLGGNTKGHSGGAVDWFDEYDPSTGKWRELPDAPHARDHFSAVIIGNELVAAAGRQTTVPSPAANPVRPTDIYDFATGTWRTEADIPTARAGAVTLGHGVDVIVLGGEINTSSAALDTVEAFDTTTGRWRALPDMITGRHGSGGGIVNDRLYMFTGATTIGGAAETSDSEYLQLLAADDVPDETVDTGGNGNDESATDSEGVDTGTSQDATDTNASSDSGDTTTGTTDETGTGDSVDGSAATDASEEALSDESVSVVDDETADDETSLDTDADLSDDDSLGELRSDDTEVTSLETYTGGGQTGGSMLWLLAAMALLRRKLS